MKRVVQRTLTCRWRSECPSSLGQTRSLSLHRAMSLVKPIAENFGYDSASARAP